MRIQVSVCSLLVCATFGLLAGADPIRTKNHENFVENLIDHHDEYFEEEDTLRLANEVAAFTKGLMVENDDGKLVEITAYEDVARHESTYETRKNLDDRVFFRLYTRKNPVEYQPLWLNDREALAASNFNAEKPTHFITHGWVNSAMSPACTLIRDAYLLNDDFNVIVVDWSKITMRPYIWASKRVIMVGKQVARMINFLEEHAKLDTVKTTLVGHSLGAHVMGLAGYFAKGTINLVVGLDPALPFFVFAGPGARISYLDANHVQIIHTNAGLLGYLEAIGHSDFYPNGGSKQVGCIIDVGGACSHARSYKFFAESINTDMGFHGRSCDSFPNYLSGRCNGKKNALMGGSVIDFTYSGKYFLATKSASPYAKGK